MLTQIMLGGIAFSLKQKNTVVFIKLTNSLSFYRVEKGQEIWQYLGWIVNPWIELTKGETQINGILYTHRG